MPAPAGHVLYGGGPADFVGAGTDGQPLTITGGVEITVYDDGTPLTDLYDASGNGPTTTITSDSFGTFEFYAPGGLGTLDVSTDGGVSLYPVQPARLGTDVVGLRTDVDAFVGGSGIPTTEKGTANGVATLNASSQVVQSVPNANVVGLSDLLAGKAGSTHGHDYVDITGLSEVAQTGAYTDLLGTPGEKEKVLLRSNGVYPTRGSTAQMAHYKGTVAPAVGGANAVDGDLWTKTIIDFPAPPA